MSRIDLAGFVDDVQGSKWPALAKRVMHEVQGLSDILLAWGNWRLLRQLGQPAFGAPWQIQPHVLVNPPHPLLVQQISVITHPVKARPKAPAAMLGHYSVEHIHHQSILGRSIHGLTAISRPRQPHTATDSRDRKPLFVNQVAHHSSLSG